MKKQNHSSKGKLDGLIVTCHECGEELPLLHPHIMVERSDDDRNPICEACWVKKEKAKLERLE